MYLLYINDKSLVCNNLTSHIRLFDNDCIMYKAIRSPPEDLLRLQEDLDRIFNWTTHWQMQLRFNVQKCVVLQCTQSHSPEMDIQGSGYARLWRDMV